jgi:hypothetical protein
MRQRRSRSSGSVTPSRGSLERVRDAGSRALVPQLTATAPQSATNCLSQRHGRQARTPRFGQSSSSCTAAAASRARAPNRYTTARTCRPERRGRPDTGLSPRSVRLPAHWRSARIPKLGSRTGPRARVGPKEHLRLRQRSAACWPSVNRRIAELVHPPRSVHGERPFSAVALESGACEIRPRATLAFGARFAEGAGCDTLRTWRPVSKGSTDEVLLALPDLPDPLYTSHYNPNDAVTFGVTQSKAPGGLGRRTDAGHRRRERQRDRHIAQPLESASAYSAPSHHVRKRDHRPRSEALPVA